MFSRIKGDEKIHIKRIADSESFVACLSKYFFVKMHPDNIKIRLKI